MPSDLFFGSIRVNLDLEETFGATPTTDYQKSSGNRHHEITQGHLIAKESLEAILALQEH
jgi:hypothetical protein